MLYNHRKLCSRFYAAVTVCCSNLSVLAPVHRSIRPIHQPLFSPSVASSHPYHSYLPVQPFSFLSKFMSPNTTSGGHYLLVLTTQNFCVFFLVAKEYKEGLYFFELVTQVFLYIRSFVG